MKSIRRQLLTRLLPGLAVIWLVAGSLLFITVHRSLTSRLDTELDMLMREVELLTVQPAAGSIPRPSAGRTLDLFVEDGGAYFQTWDAFDLFSDRSPSLGDAELPRPSPFTRDPVTWNDSTTSGERIRARAQQLVLSGSQESADEDPLVISTVVAVNRDSVDLALSQVVAGVGLVGILAAIACVGVVWGSLASGLRPLRQFGARCREIDARSLGSRFHDADLPTELHPVSESLNDLMERLRESFEREQRFSADVAHELRTPVAELKTLAECGLLWPDEDRSETTTDVLAIADQMQRILEDLLTIGRLEQGKAELTKTATCVGALVRECWEGVRTTADARQVRAVLPQGPDPTVETDAGLLRLIVSNLLSNAAAHAVPESRVEVAVGRTSSSAFWLTVTNATRGMAAADVEHVFDRFWQGDASRSSSIHHGLGLSLSRLCAEALGCRLTAQLSEDGATIMFRLVAT